MVYFSAPYLRVLWVFLFEVCMLCFIVTFHITTFDKGKLLQIKHIGFVLPTGSTNAYLSVHTKFAIFGINFSFFFVGFKARHDFRLLRKRYCSQIDLPALLPLTHTTCVTHRARGQHLVRRSEW